MKRLLLAIMILVMMNSIALADKPSVQPDLILGTQAIVHSCDMDNEYWCVDVQGELYYVEKDERDFPEATHMYVIVGFKHEGDGVYRVVMMEITD